MCVQNTILDQLLPELDDPTKSLADLYPKVATLTKAVDLNQECYFSTHQSLNTHTLIKIACVRHKRPIAWLNVDKAHRKNTYYDQCLRTILIHYKNERSQNP
ncbi:hypothetical protein [Caudoviricetes sp.]|nr:hypothetical protein [Caudoviricetes sp.]